MNILEVRDLRVYFFTRRGVVKAVDGVNFYVRPKETLGLLGESGSGKSVTCLSILRLISEPPGRIVGGTIVFNGEDLLDKSKQEMTRIRGRELFMVLQDPLTSLNPAFSIGYQLRESINIAEEIKGKSLAYKASHLLEVVSIPSPEVVLHQFPHELSGGMRQRVIGAMSLAGDRKLLIADEPTTSLDVTTQAQYLRLIKKLQEERGMSVIFVTHDFGIVANVCDRVAVMYAGKIVEQAEIFELFDRPLHPYTVALMKSVPSAEFKVERLDSIDGQPPDPINFPPGCSFHIRCKTLCDDRCSINFPPVVKITDNHEVSCWKYV